MSSKLLNKKNTKPTRHILASKKQGIVVTVRACTPNKHDFLYKFSNFQPLICSSSFVCKATRLNKVVLKAQRKFFNKKKKLIYDSEPCHRLKRTCPLRTQSLRVLVFRFSINIPRLSEAI